MEDSVFQEAAFGEAYKKTKRKKKIILAFIILFVITVSGLVVNNIFLSPGEKKEEKITITPTPTEFIFPTDTPMPTETLSEDITPTKEPKKTPTPTSKPTSNPIDKTTDLDRSALAIEVKNGGGVRGAASKMADVLKGLGYNVVSTGNADNFDYENTIIDVKADKSKYLQLLKSDLSSSYTIGAASSNLSASSSADAVVIVGK